MWQRIQTVWLLLAVLVLALFCLSDIALMSGGDATSSLLYVTPWHTTLVDSQSVASSVSQCQPVAGIVSILSALCAVLTIFLFRNRTLQVRFINLSLLLLLGLYLYIGYQLWSLSHELGLALGVRFGLAYPLVSIILLYLALRRVLFDQMLVRMSERLR